MWYPMLLAALAAYLLGNLNGSVLTSILIAHEDVRTHGSGNAGLTNFIRNYGLGGALIVIAVDAAKAMISCLVAGLLLQPYGLYREGLMLGGIMVSLGHDFPALLGFKGGKGILSGVTVVAVIDWRIALMALGVFVVVVWLTRYVSLGSILGAWAVAMGFALFQSDKPVVMWGGIFLAVLAIAMHHTNIRRLIKGTESKFTLSKKDKKG